HALARGKLLGRALELSAGGEDVAAAGRAHRRGIARIEHDLGEFLDLLPVRAFVAGAGPRVERNEIDLGRNALQEPPQVLRVMRRLEMLKPSPSDTTRSASRTASKL